jgi:MFS family permease
VADTRGRRFSFLLGAGTLLLSTLLYLVMWQIRAGLLGWALASILLGLGFTFFSGATEAWLVDALKATGFRGTLESVFAKAQIVGGLIVTRVRRLFRRRTDALILGTLLTVVLLILVGVTSNFAIALVLVVVWAMLFAIEGPLRQAYLNGVIPSEQRATVLSFDNMIGSVGGVIAKPALGRVADVNGYGASYVVAGVVQALAIPFLVLARRENAVSDPINERDVTPVPTA